MTERSEASRSWHIWLYSTAIQLIISTSRETGILLKQHFTIYNILRFRLNHFIIPDHLDVVPRSHPRHPNIELPMSEHRSPKIQPNMLHRLPLRLVDRHCKGQPHRKLLSGKLEGNLIFCRLIRNPWYENSWPSMFPSQNICKTGRCSAVFKTTWQPLNTWTPAPFETVLEHPIWVYLSRHLEGTCQPCPYWATGKGLNL